MARAARARKAGGSRKWIAGAIKRPGAFTAKAKRAGRTVQAHAAHIIGTDAVSHGRRTLKQAVLARTLGKISRRRK